MLPKTLFAAAGCALFLAISPVSAAEPLPADYALPAFDLREAIVKAEECAPKVMKSSYGTFYLASVTFEPARDRNATGPDKGRYWHVTWTSSGIGEGGLMFAKIYEDGSCELTPGK